MTMLLVGKGLVPPGLRQDMQRGENEYRKRSPLFDEEVDKVSTQMCHAYNILFMCSPVFVNISVPDPKLIISDPDPRILTMKIRNFGSGA
jgi:hypothetical protein